MYELKDITNQIYHGDCLEIMPQFPDNCIDMILCDLPYGTTSCKWDVIIPFELLWKQYKRVIKDNGAIVLTASQPFTSALIVSNIKMFKYELIWEKSNPSNIGLANKQPLKYHENICVFYNNQPIYNKQMIERDELGKKRILAGKKTGVTFKMSPTEHQNINRQTIEYCPDRYDIETKNPSSVIKIKVNRGKFHPTQKPVDLCEYLIKTYTNEGDLILDNCAGSGTTAIAAINTNRNHILIEKELKYFDIASQRISKHTKETHQ